MDCKVCCVFQLVLLLGVGLALVSPIVAGGSVEAVGLASKATGAGAYAARQRMMTQVTAAAKSTMGSEVHRRILGSISSSSLNPDRPACVGSCPAAGRPYTRGCQKAYQCTS